MRLTLSVKYALSTAVILLAVMGVTLFVISKRHEKLVIAQTEMQAKALFQQVVITRRWVADHGGVFVEKLPWVKPNSYLPRSTITDEQGRRYVKQNPALVTKKLSSYAQKEGLYFFHITSLKLMNPDNAPDAFEAAALGDFENRKATGMSRIEKIGSSHYFRYIAPLYVEKACLECHAKQGYRVGDIRGAISISVPMDAVLGTISHDRKYLLAGGVGTTAVLMLVLFVMTRRMVIKPITTMGSLMRKFSKDGDPHVPLLRTGDELEDLNASFREMAKAIDEYHACLQEKIGDATRELTEKNEALLKLNRTKSDFIAKISHELRTPLTTIKGAMDYLAVKLTARGAADDEDHLVFFEMIKKNAERLIRLVNNMLDYERIEMGRVEMKFRAADLRELFEEVVAGFVPLAEENRVTIRLTAADASAEVDEDRMKQVLTNLLSNALNFCPPSSEIAISLHESDGYVHASVADGGCGVPEDEREKIFKQFYTKGVKDGTGLGLAICKGIIEAHSGEIGVTSGGSGGSCFWFRIPKTRNEVALDEKSTSCGR